MGHRYVMPGTQAMTLAVKCASKKSLLLGRWLLLQQLYFNNSVRQTLVEAIGDGTSWTIVTSPTTNGTQSSVFSGVTCASASGALWAVGSSNTASAAQTLSSGGTDRGPSLRLTPAPRKTTTSPA